MKKYSIILRVVIVIMIANLLLFGNAVCGDEGAFKSNISGWEKAGGAWSIAENGYKGNNKASGDSFMISNQYIDGSKSFVYECDFTIEGQAAGIVFGAKDRKKPGTSWYCLNYDMVSSSARAFFVKGGLKWNVSAGLTTSSLSRNIHKFKVVYVKNAEISFYVDDITVGNYTTKDFEGGYLGFMTCLSNSIFQNVNYHEFEAPKITSLDFVNIEFNNEFDDSINEYLAYVDYNTKELQLNAVFDDNIKIKVEDKSLKSGETTSVPLKIGCNQLRLYYNFVIEDGVQVEVSKSLIVHRKQKDNLLYQEDYRPQLHFTSAYEWINDPNGMTYNASTGEYHLFYQTRPRTSAIDANQCWYHAVSKDLIHWKQVAPAIAPDGLGFCWSGSGGIDKYNTSGLFDESTDPDGRMVIIYSSVFGDTYYGTEKISLAYSNDQGATWTKYSGNPIIKNGANYVQKYNDGFRDPKLVWYKDPSYKNGGIWILLVGGGQGRIFSSTNLIDWNYESSMKGVDGKPLSGECPDFFSIKVENEQGAIKWVYISGQVNLNIKPESFQTSGVVGSFGKNEQGKFVFTAQQDLKQVLYGGNTMYATQSFSNTADGRIIQMSWDRESLDITGTGIEDKMVKDWSGLMSWPLELKLYNDGGKYIFKSYPIEEMKSLRNSTLFKADNKKVTPGDTNLLSDVKGSFYEIETEITLGSAKEFGFKVRKGGNREIVIKGTDYNVEDKTILITVDAGNGGKYPGGNSSVRALVVNGGITLRIVVDTNIIDVFANNGEQSVYAIAYPEPGNSAMEFYTNQGDVTVKSMAVYELNSIWTGDISNDSNSINNSSNNINNYTSVILNCIISVLAVVLVCLSSYAAWLLNKK